MRKSIYFIIASLLVACASGQNRMHPKSDETLLVNTSFHYLPDTIKTNKEIFLFASYLGYVDTVKDYKDWYDSISIYGNSVYDLYEEDTIYSYIKNNYVDKIKEDGCTASAGEAMWLVFGIELYRTLHDTENIINRHNCIIKPLLQDENEKWNTFLSHFFPLVSFKVSNSTGTAGAYEEPFRNMKIMRLRHTFIKQVDELIKGETIQSYSKDSTIDTHRIEKWIDDIGLTREYRNWDYPDDYISYIKENKDLIGPALDEWVESLLQIERNIKTPESFISVSNDLLDNIYNMLYKINH